MSAVSRSASQSSTGTEANCSACGLPLSCTAAPAQSMTWPVARSGPSLLYVTGGPLNSGGRMIRARGRNEEAPPTLNGSTALPGCGLSRL